METLELGDQRARDKTFAATMAPSLDLLTPEERRRTYELSIFAEDTAVEIGLLALLWGPPVDSPWPRPDAWPPICGT
jgi:hypothetical protein